MRSHVRVAALSAALLTLVCLPARAGVRFNIEWRAQSWLQDTPTFPWSCGQYDTPFGDTNDVLHRQVPLTYEWFDPSNSDDLDHGDDFFAINGIVLRTTDRFHPDEPAYDQNMPGVYKTGVRTLVASWINTYDTEFSASLLRPGLNELDFDSEGALYRASGFHGPEYSNIDTQIILESPTIGRRVLWASGRTCSWWQRKQLDIDLELEDIDPDLARALDQLRQAIRDERARLLALAGDADAAPAEIARFEALEAEIDALFENGFDQITSAMLDDLFDRYWDVLPDGFADRLAELLIDLKADVDRLRADLQAEIERLMSDLSGLDDVSVREAVGSGFDPDDPATFDPDTSAPPDVDIPGTGTWDTDHDPYNDYALSIIERLDATFEGDVVRDRAAFLDIVAEWEVVQEAFEGGLRGKPALSPEEFRAFIDARLLVFRFFDPYLDRDRWFRDSSVPPDLRELVDLLAAMNWYARAKRLQRNLAGWHGELTPQQGAVVELLRFMHSTLLELRARRQVEDQSLWGWFTDTLDDVIDFAGDFILDSIPGMDLCRALTGKESCFFGRELTREERIIAVIGAVAIGGGAIFKRIARRMRCVAGGVLSARAGVIFAARTCAKKEAVKSAAEAIDEVKKLKPSRTNPNFLSSRGLPDGSTVYRHKDGWEIRYTPQGFPDFTPFLYPDPDKAVVRIVYKGSWGADFAEASKRAGFVLADGATPCIPVGYVWHHVEDATTMQLVGQKYHNAARGGAPHAGGVATHKKVFDLSGYLRGPTVAPCP